MDQGNSSLVEASQQPNVSGALQQLLLSQSQGNPSQQQAYQQAMANQQRMQQLLLARQNSPEASQQIQQDRKSGLQQYQEALHANPSGNFTPNDQSMASWVANLANGQRGFNAVAGGIAAGAGLTKDNEASLFKNNVTAAKAGYDDAVGQDMLDSRELGTLRTSIGSSASSGTGTGTLEKILPLYGKVLNSVSQQAKDMQFSTPAERTAWIRSRTDEIVGSAVSQFGGNVKPEMLERLHNEAQSSATSSEPTRVSSIEPSQRIRSASSNNSSTPPPGMQISPQTQIARDAEATRLRNGEVTGDLPAWPKMPAEPSMSPEQRAKFSQLTPQGSPPFVNKPNELLMKSGAEGMGKAYAAEYGLLTDAAAAAKDQYDAYNSLEKMSPNTNMFANAQGYIGNALQGLGVDPSSPIIQDAIKNKEATALISQMSNAALRGEKGVQTRSDEVRIGKELAATTDPKQAWNYLIALGKERALRKMDMGDFAAQNAEANNGVPIAPRQKYINATVNDPLTQEFGGKLIFRTPTIEAFMRKYPDADKQEAVDYWRSLENNWAKRQGAR